MRANAGPCFYSRPIPLLAVCFNLDFQTLNVYEYPFVCANIQKGQNGPRLKHEKNRMFYYSWSWFNFSIFFLFRIFRFIFQCAHFECKCHEIAFRNACLLCTLTNVQPLNSTSLHHSASEHFAFGCWISSLMIFHYTKSLSLLHAKLAFSLCPLPIGIVLLSKKCVQTDRRRAREGERERAKGLDFSPLNSILHVSSAMCHMPNANTYFIVLYVEGTSTKRFIWFWCSSSWNVLKN